MSFSYNDATYTALYDICPGVDDWRGRLNGKTPQGIWPVILDPPLGGEVAGTAPP